MDELICRSRKGRTTPAEEAALLSWRRQSKDNETYFREFVRLLNLGEAAIRKQGLPGQPLAIDLIRRADERTASARPPTKLESPRTGWAWWGGIAAAAAAGVAAILMLASPVPTADRHPAVVLGAGEFVTGPSETGTATLGDGTIVRLGPQSRLQIVSAEDAREVFLEGRAYFAVAPMHGYPFRVRTRAGDAVVLGTRFEVRTRKDDLRLVVIEGRVALGANGQQVEVGAGEMSMVSDGNASPPVKVDDVRPLVSWLERFIAFQATPLREVVWELEREYGVRIEVTDSALVDQTLTGWYADRDFEEVFTIVCGVLQAECSIQNGIARIGR